MHSTKIFIYLCIGYLLVMYSTLKILPGLKLTFLLIIFGLAGIYMLEHGAHMRKQQIADQANYLQNAGMNPPGLVSQETNTMKSLPDLQGAENPDPAESGQSIVKINSLSDLGLHIEL